MSASRLGVTFCLLALGSSCLAAEMKVEHRLAPRTETLLPTPSFTYRAVVMPDGALRYGDGVRLSVAFSGDVSPPRGAAPTQKLLGNALPIIVTTTDGDRLSLELTAFGAASPAMDCLRAVVRNKTAGALSPVVRVTAHGAHGLLATPRAGFQRDGLVLALCETREGKAELPAAPKPMHYVFQQRGGKPLANWGKPKVACDPGFRHIVAGFEEPATFRLKAEPGKRYIVAFGLCESHWKDAGNRICDLLIEGQKVATVDPVKDHGTDVPFVLAFPATDRNKDGWIEATSVASRGSPDQNSIINVLWLFEEAVGKGLQAADILGGGANDKAACYVDCGGGGTTAAPRVSTLDFHFELQPNASATLWLKKPHQPVKTADASKLAESDGAKLLAAAEQAWAEARGKANWITLGDPAPSESDLLFLAYVSLRCLVSREGAGAIVRPDPFSTAFSPRVCARAATALDSLGAHADAAAILAGLIARQGDDRLWEEGGGPWRPTGLVLQAFARHFDLTGDKAWLEASYPALLHAAEAILDARELTKWVAHDPDATSHGLMPSAAYGAVPPGDCVIDTLMAAVGVRAVAQLARERGKPNDCVWLKDNLRDMDACIVRASKQHAGPVRAEAKGVLPLALEAAVHITNVRYSLVVDLDDELHLLSKVPKAWLTQELSVTNLPTAFGPLSYKATLSPDGRKLIVEPQLQARRQPKSLVIHPPLPAGEAKPLIVTDFRGGKLELDLK
ncbi:MAG TPA: hypothetical protein VNE39_21255 [Planctomycetota bacterium]|nr:hypothetical protein [Planctomycetota bacterium]